MNFIQNLKDDVRSVLTRPDEFFKSKHREGLKPALFYYAALNVIYVIGSLILELIFPTPGLNISTDLLLLLAPLSWVIWVFFSFIFSGIFHISVRILGGRGSYTETYKAFVYGTTPILLLGWLFLNLFPLIWFILLIFLFPDIFHILFLTFRQIRWIKNN